VTRRQLRLRRRGLLAEDHVRGSTLGPTLERILTDQFTRLRSGDRYWFERVFSGRLLKQIDRTTLADIIRRNTEIDNLQDNVFIFEVRIKGTIFFDRNGNGRQDRRETGLAGVQVELLDSEGTVIATTRTSRGGHYRFANINEPGTFTLRVIPRFGAEATTENPQEVTATRGQVLKASFGFSLRTSFSVAISTSDGAGHGVTRLH
jgi:hypothetical protein